MAVAFVLLVTTGNALAACGVIRFAYPDQHRPPYWLGNGETVPEPPGAGVEFVRELAASADCALALVRLPVLRLRPALVHGSVDLTPVDISADGQPGIVLPRDAAGKPDIRRGTSSVVVLFIRRKHAGWRALDPLDFVHGRTVGVIHGASYGARLEQAGATLDHGATTASGNFEKLRLGRIDGFVLSLIAPGDLDKFIASRYGNDIVRVEKPILRMHMWLAANQAFYDSHRPQVEAIWNWIGSEGNRRYHTILRKYTEQ